MLALDFFDVRGYQWNRWNTLANIHIQVFRIISYFQIVERSVKDLKKQKVYLSLRNDMFRASSNCQLVQKKSVTFCYLCTSILR